MAKSKSASAFRTIGEVANELNISPHVLRFWESKFKQIKPHKRRGGHRYYRQMDIEIIREVKSLLYDRGFTIKGAQNYLKEQKQQESSSGQNSLFDAVDPPRETNKATSGSNMTTVISELHTIKELLSTRIG